MDDDSRGGCGVVAVIIATVAALVPIFIFVTGIETIPDIIDRVQQGAQQQGVQQGQGQPSNFPMPAPMQTAAPATDPAIAIQDCQITVRPANFLHGMPDPMSISGVEIPTGVAFPVTAYQVVDFAGAQMTFFQIQVNSATGWVLDIPGAIDSRSNTCP